MVNNTKYLIIHIGCVILTNLSIACALVHVLFDFLNLSVIMTILSSPGWWRWRNGLVHCEQKDESPGPQAGTRRPDLPTFRLSEVKNHSSKEKGLWVLYKDGVYDITDFLVGHPGGDKILLAAGASVEPFWELYAIHQNPEVLKILETLRIGNLHPDDRQASPTPKGDGPFAHDPTRHPALRVNSEKPFNAEVPTTLLVDNMITPNELFFVRNHLPVPEVDQKAFRLHVDGGRKSVKLSLNDLRSRFKPHSVVATVQCAGNRRSELSLVRPVKGLSWSHGAISTAEWTGVRLSDVLRAAGVEGEKFAHCIFEGLDKDMEGQHYEASIPMETAFDPEREVLLAYEMNGKPLPRDHGFPLRVIVPGTIGARQVKWVRRVRASHEESNSHWQRNDYKTFHPSIDAHTANYSRAVAIQEYPTQAAICFPPDGSTVEGDEVTVKGYAWSGGGRGILRVEITPDGGQTWHEAELQMMDQRTHKQWAWSLWEATVPLPPDHNGRLKLACRATDSSHNTQPESLASIWNFRGLVNNAWHHVELAVDAEE